MDLAVMTAVLGAAVLVALAARGQKRGNEPEPVAVPVRVRDTQRGFERRQR